MFKSMFGDAIKDIMREVLDERKAAEPEVKQDRFYTREEVCQKLSICHATFHNWKNKGVFKTKKISGRLYVFADVFDEDFSEEKFQKFHIKPMKTR